MKKPNENIKINDIIYKLDSCITINYNKNKQSQTHVIAGITYDDKSYIYNGWTIPKKQDTKIKPYTKEHKYACPLFNVNWKQLLHEKEGYCLSQKDCNITQIDELNNYCFNFSKRPKLTTLLYIKKEEKTSYIPEIKLKEDIKK